MSVPGIFRATAAGLPLPFYADDRVTLYHGDALELLPRLFAALPDGDAVIVTDPPYGTGGRRRASSGAGSKPACRIVREAWDTGDVVWLDGCLPVLAFFPPANAARLLVRAHEVGLEKHRMLALQKRDPAPQFAGRMALSLEPVWALSRPGWTLLGGTDVFVDSTPRLGRDADATGHPYQKPVDFMRWLIAKTSEACIVDPFAGSGTTLRAAKDLGRYAIGIEQDARWCAVAAARMAQEAMPWA